VGGAGLAGSTHLGWRDGSGSGRAGPSEQPPAALVEVAGPRQERLVDMAARLIARRRQAVEILAVGEDGPDEQALASGVLVPGPEAMISGPSFQNWLDAGEREPTST
jgi:hypothetical protein